MPAAAIRVACTLSLPKCGHDRQRSRLREIGEMQLDRGRLEIAKLAAGTHTLMSRVIDTQGNVQAENAVDNAGGYGNSSWRAHALTVTVV